MYSRTPDGCLGHASYCALSLPQGAYDELEKRRAVLMNQMAMVIQAKQRARSHARRYKERRLGVQVHAPRDAMQTRRASA
jgi:hypothetical protein